jgi:putative ABC transport system permease protein
MARTALAWANLTHDRVRFGLFVLGITFAVVLMFVQLGFRNALLDSNTQLHSKLDADLVMVSPNRGAIVMREPFPRRRLMQAASVAGVRSVHPLYLENAIGMLRDTNPDLQDRLPTRGIRVIGVDLDAHLLNLPELDPHGERSQIERLRTPGTALFDRRTKSEAMRGGLKQTSYGPLAPGTRTELTGKSIELVGDFELGTDFTADGTLIVSEQTFLELLRKPYTLGPATAQVDIGLIRLEPGTDLETAKREIQAALATGEEPGDVEILTVDELKGREKSFWLTNTPIGFAFGFGMFMGFAVGLVICYQILSGDVSDHLPEYATLKAMGHGNLYLARVVVQESLILAVAGFAVGFVISWGAYSLLTASTGLPMEMTPMRVGSLFLATVGLCVVSGLIALIGLIKADPADVF